MRLGVVGSGTLAGVRGREFARLADVEVAAVVSRTPSHAQRLAAELGATTVDDLGRLACLGLDAVLVALPHRAQDPAVRWALERGLHVLVGGPLALSAAAAGPLLAAADTGRIVEAGYEARYKSIWLAARSILESGGIGDPVCVRAVAYVDQDPASWYANEYLSGGMLVTHLTYAFLNPLRWLLGEPTLVGAASNARRAAHPSRIRHETCTVLLKYPGGVVASTVVSYVKPETLVAWDVSILGTAGSVELSPGDLDGGSLLHHRDRHPVSRLDGPADGFARQVRTFTDAVHGHGEVRNPPADAVRDLVLCDEIEAFLTGQRTSRDNSDQSGGSR